MAWQIADSVRWAISTVWALALTRFSWSKTLRPGERALEHVAFEPEVLAAAVLRRTHLALDDLDDILADGQELEAGGGLDAGGVEGGVEMGHGMVS